MTLPVPTQDQVMGQLRTIIPALGTIASAFGFSAATANSYVNTALAAVGPISYVVVAVWQMISDSRRSIMKAAAKPVAPGVAPPQIVLPPEENALAQALPANVRTSDEVHVVKNGVVK